MAHQFKTVDIKGKSYVQVHERIDYFRNQEEYKGWSLRTRILKLDKDECVFEGVIRNESGQIRATGLAHEVASSSYINKTSYIENCETSAWGRALGNLGIGIKTSIATAEEVDFAVKRQESTSNAVQSKNTSTNKFKVSDKQIKRFYALKSSAGISDEAVEILKKKMNIESLNDMSRQQYDATCSRFQEIIDSKHKDPPKKEKKEVREVTFKINPDEIPF